MPLDKKLRKILLIGSGPIVIGQAAEFDYSGSQACKAIREEGIQVVLVNSNPATIQTDLQTADRVYLEPLVPEVVARIIEKEKPDGFIATMSGQTGLNLAVALRGVLEKNGVKVLGTDIETIELAEDREKFRDLMHEIGEPIPQSARAHSLEEARAFAGKNGFPVIVRADFCLGGSGSGIANNDTELESIVRNALHVSGGHGVLVEQSVGGLAELEYEVIRDAEDNCITICNMENVDPMGIHTGESIVVAPSQTLSDDDHQMLRTAAIKIIRALGVKGACNIQFALDQDNGKYWVIEVNPRASRSSALASKATGYPIARVAAKIALGYSLPEIENKVTGKTACFEPALDYVVLKIPKWPFDKLRYPGKLGTSMKSTGETMSIGRTFEEALQKAVRSLELRRGAEEESKAKGFEPHELRLFTIKNALREGATPAELAGKTRINEWFITKISNIVEMEKRLAQARGIPDAAALAEAKKLGFSDYQISSLSQASIDLVRNAVKEAGIQRTFKMVDTCAAEYEALTPYFYSTFEKEDESAEKAGKAGKAAAAKTATVGKKKVIILGSGPIRIGQGIEFDYCTVHAVQALREAGYETITVNNNPETVSTDFDVSDKLYFEPLTLDDVLPIVRREQQIAEAEGATLEGVIVQFGGQTAINLALPLHEKHVRVLGTSVTAIDITEDRKKFKRLAKSLGIPIVESGLAYSVEEAVSIAEYVGYPVLIRPSYVLGGRAMETVDNEKLLRERVEEAVHVSDGHPVTIDHFIQDGTELDVDVIGDGKRTCIAGIMEQIDEAGIHSGDSACAIPPRSVSAKALERVRDYTRRLCGALGVNGAANIQMAVKGDEVIVLEVNPRGSRTLPFISKATGVPIAKVAAKLQVGAETLDSLGLPEELKPLMPAVKVPVFPFARFPGIDPKLGAEMKSTGETMGLAPSFEEAFLKALLAAGQRFSGTVALDNCGKWTKVLRTKLKAAGLKVIACTTAEEAARLVEAKQAQVLVSGLGGNGDGQARKAAAIAGIPCVTSAFAALAVAESLKKLGKDKRVEDIGIIALNDLGGKK